jgi:subtilase family serine protease
VRGRDQSGGRRAWHARLLVCAVVALAALQCAAATAPAAADDARAAATPTRAAASAERQVFLLGLRQRGRPGRLARRLSTPSSNRYRDFLSPGRYRKRFGASRRNRRTLRRYLRARRGVKKLELASNGALFLAVLTPQAGKRIFCAGGGRGGVSGPGLCIPRALRGAVRLTSAGEIYTQGGGTRSSRSGLRSATNNRDPQGCGGALAAGGFTPNQLATAYGVDELHAGGLEGAGIRVATLSSQEVEVEGFATWAQCFGLAAPDVRQVAMPGATRDTGTAPEETVLDVEALASLAPGLDRITPIYVPLDQSFSNSFLLFMYGALDPSRLDGELPHILSISDGVCEVRFTADELRLGQRLLAEAATLGITTLAASGDLGFQGCFISKRGALFPASSRFVTSVGGTDLTLTADNQIAEQVVWSTYATEGDQGVGSGGGPSRIWSRPSFQQAPGIGAQLQRGKPTRLSPDVAAMASFTPGLAVYQQGGGGWGIGGGTSAATPLTAAIVALALQREQAAGRPAIGSLSPLLYALARGPDYGSIFFDVTTGTSSRQPNSAVGMSPAGGAAQPGYDLATGLGSLKASPFADAVAARGD